MSTLYAPLYAYISSLFRYIMHIIHYDIKYFSISRYVFVTLFINIFEKDIRWWSSITYIDSIGIFRIQKYWSTHTSWELADQGIYMKPWMSEGTYYFMQLVLNLEFSNLTGISWLI